MSKPTFEHFPRDKRLLVFQGGGYDGCFWEYNAIYIDLVEAAEKGEPFQCRAVLAEGKHDISGYRGKAVLAACKENLTKGIRLALQSSNEGARYYSSEYEGFLVRNDAEWDDFVKNYSEGIVRSIAKKLGADIECQRCHTYHDAEDIFHSGYHGCGGLAIAMDGLFCSECMHERHDEYAAKEWASMDFDQRMEVLTDGPRNPWNAPTDLAGTIEYYRENQFPESHRDYWSDEAILKFIAADDELWAGSEVFGDAYSY